MQVYNNKVYNNSIYKGIVVNNDISLDPLKQGRVQIYMPTLTYEFDNVYEEYMNSDNKSESKYFGSFPWAITLVEGLNNGDYIYGSYINNTNGNCIILGKDISTTELNAGQGGDGGTLNGLDIISLIMPVILMEETGYGKSDCPLLPTWPDGYPDSIFQTIENNSSSARGIGILQWTASRAYDLLYDIANASGGEWENCWSDKDLQLYKQLKQSLVSGSSSANRNNNPMCNALSSSSSTYKSVQKMLQLSCSRKVQEDKAPDDTQKAVDILESEPYNITNPGIIIFYADIMNQYGNGVNSVISNCITNAAKIDKNGKDIMDQITEVYNQWKSRTKLYADRRSRVYSYISWLYEQGKLQTYNLVSTESILNSEFVPEYGEYLWPCAKTTYITAYWGDSSIAYNYDFKNYNSSSKKMGYGSMSRWHAGVDFGCPQGEEALATGDGVVSYVCSPEEGASGGQGGCIIIQMDKNKDYYFAYMHLREKPTLKVGDKVKAGQVVGYTGNTGNSTGPHLHIGLHIKSPWGFNGKSRDSRIDPLPHLGKKMSS